MKKDLQEAFEAIRRKLGSHGAAAKELGINRDHYCAMRNGRANIPARTADYILLKAQEIEGQDMPPLVCAAAEQPEARP